MKKAMHWVFSPDLWEGGWHSSFHSYNTNLCIMDAQSVPSSDKCIFVQDYVNY